MATFLQHLREANKDQPISEPKYSAKKNDVPVENLRTYRPNKVSIKTNYTLKPYKFPSQLRTSKSYKKEVARDVLVDYKGVGYLLTLSQYQKFMQQQQTNSNTTASSTTRASQEVDNVVKGLEPNTPCLLMQNEMVSIPAANLNGSLKTGTNVVNNAVLTNSPRVFLASASTNPSQGSSGSTTTTVRYFSQFSKLQQLAPPVQQLGGGSGPTLQLTTAGQRKIVNGDTMLLVNGASKPFVLTTSATIDKLSHISSAAATAPTSATTSTFTSNVINAASSISTSTVATATVPNGTGKVIQKPYLIEQQQLQVQHLHQRTQQLVSVIKPTSAITPSISPSNTIASADGNMGKPFPDQPKINSNSNELSTKQQDDAEPELDIVINNVVCSFSVRCHLKLRDIALHGFNVEYRRENGMVTMKLRRPYTTASIWSSGRITCTGATSENQAKIAARRYARCLEKLGFPVYFQNFRIVNVLGTCSMPWAIKIVNFSERHRENASYEPELHPGVTYKMREPKATLKIFSTGSITVTAASVNDVESAIQHIYPLVYEFRKTRSPEELQQLRQKQRHIGSDLKDSESMCVVEGNTDTDNFFNTKSMDKDSTVAGDKYQSYSQQQAGNDYRQSNFNTNPSTTTVCLSGNAAPSSTTTSNLNNACANARRRATEGWASKLQNKRPRYNDLISTVSPITGSGNRSCSTNDHASSIGNSFSKMRGKSGKPLLPVEMVLKQSSSRTRNASLHSIKCEQSLDRIKKESLIKTEEDDTQQY